MLCLKIAGWEANSVDPNETPRSAAPHLGLYCLLRHVCPNTYGKYGIYLPKLEIKAVDPHLIPTAEQYAVSALFMTDVYT